MSISFFQPTKECDANHCSDYWGEWKAPKLQSPCVSDVTGTWSLQVQPCLPQLIVKDYVVRFRILQIFAAFDVVDRWDVKMGLWGLMAIQWLADLLLIRTSPSPLQPKFKIECKWWTVSLSAMTAPIKTLYWIKIKLRCFLPCCIRGLPF